MSSSNANALPNLIFFPEDRQLVGLNNWAVFRDHVKSVARSSGLDKYLDGTISAPAAAPTAANATFVVTPINSRNPTVEEWELRDARLAGIIYQNIKDPRSIGVTQDMTSHVMWTTLTGEYENTSAAAQALAKERVQQCKYVPGTPFEEYFKNLEGLRKAANDMGCNVMDTEIRARFLTINAHNCTVTAVGLVVGLWAGQFNMKNLLLRGHSCLEVILVLPSKHRGHLARKYSLGRDRGG
ncbi:hypothetical protein D9757_011825 [Collybiopsis confluens]|uniref:Uncharacterized protein n=1 Tax=Collybiopsis confluens TaxID=2823264 RepID=A0A8H5LYP4_9AGAR|nr:hypothetical protein D9757_011825 [Collybiopsis confluens]